jgi:hypothetical protein
VESCKKALNLSKKAQKAEENRRIYAVKHRFAQFIPSANRPHDLLHKRRKAQERRSYRRSMSGRIPGAQFPRHRAVHGLHSIDK